MALPLVAAGAAGLASLAAQFLRTSEVRGVYHAKKALHATASEHYEKITGETLPDSKPENYKMETGDFSPSGIVKKLHKHEVNKAIESL